MTIKKHILVKYLSVGLLSILLASCTNQSVPAVEETLVNTRTAEPSTPTPEPPKIEEQIIPIKVTTEPTAIPSEIFLQETDFFANANSQPVLWTNINLEEINFYPFDRLYDYIYDNENNLWMAGGFGILKVKPDGSQTWYTMKNGLPHNYYRVIAAAPNGDIWAGGYDNTLVHFDGQKWTNEGEKLPEPFDSNSKYLCQTSNILGIDFADDGSVWVMNGKIELYHQIGEEWVNVYFPKEMLPASGGGGCPIGILVHSETNITVTRNGC